MPKVTDPIYPALTSISSDDLLYIVDSPGGTPVSKKVSFGNLSKSGDLLKSFYNVHLFGAIGDGVTDDTVAIQAAITAAIAAQNGTVVFPATGGNGDTDNGYLVADSLIIEPSVGDARGSAQVGIVSNDTRGIVWGGSDNSSVFITRGWKLSKVERLNIQIPATSDGVVCWDITDPAGAISSSYITFDICSVQLLGTNCIGWRGGGLDSGATDISFLKFDNCIASGSAAGDGHIGWFVGHGNCLNWTWYGGFGWNLDVMVEASYPTPMGGGSMFFYGLGSSHNLLEFRPGGQGPWSIFGGRFEEGKRFLECGQYDGGNGYPMNITISGAEISAYTPDDGILFMMGTSGSLLLDNTWIWNGPHVVAWDENMFKLGGWAGGYGSLTIRGGSIQNASEPFYMIGYGHWTVRIENVGKMETSGYLDAQYTELPEVITESTYTRKTLATSPVVFWPLWEKQEIVAHDLTGRGNHGLYATSGVTLGQPGFGDGKLCPTFAGTGLGVELFSAGLAALLGGEGSLMMWLKVYADFWTDGLLHNIISLGSVDSVGVFAGIYKSAANVLTLAYRANNVWKDTGIVTTSTAWMNLVITWSTVGDKVGYFLNGVQQGAYLDTLGIWTGPVVFAQAATIDNGAPYQIGGVALWNKALTQAQITDLASLF